MEKLGLKSREKKERVLTWRGGGSGDDPFADGGETSIPTAGVSVVPSGTKRTCGNEIGTEESSAADGVEMGRGFLVFDF